MCISVFYLSEWRVEFVGTRSCFRALWMEEVKVPLVLRMREIVFILQMRETVFVLWMRETV